MKSLYMAPALALLVGLSQLTCHQVILTAPPGSSITCFANPTFVAAHGDVAVVSAILFDGTGAPVADGTVVQFFTNLGRIPEQGKTNDGVVRVNFTSDSRSGRATITAFSGGQGGPSVTTNTTGTTVQSGPAAAASFDATSFATSSSALASAALATCSVPEIIVGSSRPARVVVTANPPRLTDSRTSEINAIVYDSSGNPVENVPLIFRSENGSLGFIESGGAPQYTDSNGHARDVFRTRLARDLPSVPARIDVLTPLASVNGDVLVYIN